MSGEPFRSAADVEVIVLEVDPSGRRIRLSAKAVAEAREADEVREWTERNAPPAGWHRTFADKLRSRSSRKRSDTLPFFTALVGLPHRQRRGPSGRS